MKRRDDVIGGRGEAVSSLMNNSGPISGPLTHSGPGLGGGGPGGAGAVTGTPGGAYVRGAPAGVTATQIASRPGQPTTPVAAAASVASGAPVPGVVPVPATTSGQIIGAQGTTILDHFNQNISNQQVFSGYGGGKVEMHTGVQMHAGIPAAYSTTMTQGPPPQGSVGPSMVQTAAAVAAAAAGSTQGSGQFQRLKVEDALSYLDQVKLRFGKQPQVYNDFLDIMKEFKSQSIDTPGVIARVSQLFRGHPELIVGFNTFLPPGYKIEVSVSVPGQQTTVVHTPQGVHHHITSTHPPPPPQPQLTVKPQHHTPQQQRGGSAMVSQGVSHAGSGVGPHSVHGVGSIPVSVNQVPGGGGPTIGGPPPSGPPTGGSLVGGNTGLAGQQQHSTNTAPQHPTRGEPQPPPPPGPPHHPQLHPPGPPHHQPPAQPVEFNHAINYVNKIKLRFQGQPDIYKQFLEILHTYQKEQRHIKDGGAVPQRTLTETEVYEKVAKLFENQEDLLQEFGQFLPDATNNSAAMSDFMDHYSRSHHVSTKSVSNDHGGGMKKPSLKGSNCTASGGNNLVSGNTGSHGGSGNNTNKTSPMYGPGPQLKRPHSGPAPAGHVNVGHGPAPPVKKPKLNYLKDMSAAEAGKYATLAEYAFFDQVRKALRHEETYHNFLRCITLYNEEIISRSELVQLVHPFLIKFPDLLKWFKDFVGFRDPSMGGTDIIPSSVTKQERISGDMAMEIDYTTCKRLGASYCALPKSYPQPKCSGRNSLCREVLNDTWVSFPSWSEDSTFVTSRKTQYEEYIYRCEDERFELDVVLETNLATMRVLEGVHKKLQRMSPEEAARFRLDDCLGGTSPTIHQRAIKRIYGDKASDIIDGLKKNPVVAVPLVLRRLKAKDEEWREAQKGFNKIWREQNEKYYLKSLDHQGITFKQTDVKTIRSKSLLNDIETLFDERHEQQEEVGEVITGPHLVLHYKDGSTLEDAANLVIHHVKRQTTVHKDDKHKIKQLVRHFVPDLFFHSRQEMSDDECGIDDEECEDGDDTKSNESKSETAGRSLRERDIKQEKQELNKQNQLTSQSTETTNTTTTTTVNTITNNCNNSSSKRKTRNRTNENEKDSEGKTGKDSNGNNNNKSKESSKNKSSLNGDATEDEKINIKSEPDEEKVQIKQEPDSNGNGNVESDDEYRLFMCNNNWYLFLRLHQILCSRLHFMYEQAVKIAAEEAKDRKDRKESTAVALRLKPKNEIAVDDYYPALLDMVKNVLDGNLESTAYEDTLREMFGIHAFNGFTLDKVVTGAVRQLQHLVCDEPPAQCTTMFIQELRKGGGGGPLRSAHTRLAQEQAYQKRSEKHLQDENCFKIYAYKKDCRMTVELIDTEIEEDTLEPENGQNTNVPAHSTSISPAISEVERWSEYVEKYVSAVEPQMSPAMQAQLSRKPVFLPRNLRSWRKLASRQSSLEGDKNSNIEEVKPPVLCSDLSLVDNTQCKFNLSSFKRVFIVNSDSCMYKKQALKRAKQSHEAVSHRMHSGLASWHSEWCTRHISEADQRAATDWFMGNIDGLRPHHTRLVRIDNPSKSPYTMYNKYKCELIENST